jgi:O-antigen/teichoic acid export membrane protein
MDSASLKQKVARGAVNNLVFAGIGSGLSYLQVILVMRILGPAEIGLFALASAIVMTLDPLSDFGIGDRLIQQDATDLQESYESAVTLQLLLSLVLWVIVIATAPILAKLYHQPRLTSLMIATSYVAFTGLMQLPLSLLFRELRYFEQRFFVFLGKAAGFVVALGLVLLGAGVWCLVFAGLTELLVTAIPAWKVAPLRPRWRFSIENFRRLINFGFSVWMAKLSYVLVQQGSILVLSALLLVRDVGEFRAAEQLVGLVIYLEVVLGQTIFPVLCKIKDQKQSLESAFMKASRISMLWIAGTSFFLWLFADPLVRYVLTPKWHGAELFLKAQGIGVLFGATIFNWDVLCKAKNATRMVFYVSALFALAFAGIFVPMVFIWRREGAAAGVIFLMVLSLAARKFCLHRLKIEISVTSVARRALVSASLATGAALGFEHFVHMSSPLLAFAWEATVYLLVYSAIAVWLERNLIREAAALLLNRNITRAGELNLTTSVG